jgi:hypothetical protein
MKPPASGSKLRYCGGCNAKAYCTKRCAQADWAEHKLVCEALRKTRDTAVGAFEALGGKKEEFNESNRVKKAWFASVPGTPQTPYCYSYVLTFNLLIPNPEPEILNPESHKLRQPHTLNPEKPKPKT